MLVFDTTKLEAAYPIDSVSRSLVNGSFILLKTHIWLDFVADTYNDSIEKDHDSLSSLSSRQAELHS